MIDVIIAKKHTPDYLLHKYWARKPHNVLSVLLKNLLDKEANVVDPFCGSGVFLREASKLGHNCYGYDINPTAYLLSKITCNPPSLNDFVDNFEPILNLFKIETEKLYKTINGQVSRYFVHEVIVTCLKCKFNQIKIGNLKKCFKCNHSLSFSLENLTDTNIVKIITENETISKKDEIIFAKKNEKKNKIENSLYNLKFYENRRILSHKNMETKDLFTARNFYLLSFLADKIHKIKDEKIKNTCILLLTGSSAQCSRLIPYRNNLTTGGPSWSVPGFWVPHTHLESNPYNHISARYKKFCKGLDLLSKFKTKPVKIYNEDCLYLKSKLNKKVDLFFLDPPYGDSVPYLEFSMMWNSFVKLPINIKDDISVSDRNNKKNISWSNYEKLLSERIFVFRKNLSKNGKFLITFNNYDTRAWLALLKPLQEMSMKCIHTFYQIPPVISSKSQFSKKGSYIGDIYSLYENSKKLTTQKNLETVKNDLVNSANSRDYILNKNLIYRITFLSFLRNNVSYHLLNDVENLIEEIFKTKDNSYELKDSFLKKSKKLNIKKICSKILKNFKNKKDYITLDDFYSKLAPITKKIGIPEPLEITKILSDQVVLKNNNLYFKNKEKKKLSNKI